MADLDEHRIASRETCLQVLRYWHQLEFFTPFNLDNVLALDTLDICLKTLQDETANQLFPWLNKKENPFHYELYLLPFDKKAHWGY